MKNIVRITASIVLVFSLLYGNILTVLACGPFTVEPIFQFTKHGSYPLNEFTKGKTGAVPTSYGRISLFVFYRHLNNLPFTNTERDQVVAAINHRIGVHWQENQSAEASKPETKKLTEQDYLNKWIKSRSKVIPADPKIETDKSIPESYQYYTNCLGDSFNTAAETLDDRIAKYGVSGDVKNWVAGQDTVFSNCSEEGKIPQAAPANSPVWLQKDRDYQIAAALLYASKIPQSRSRFEKIAADENSIWKATSKYVVARTYIREASFLSSEELGENRPNRAFPTDSNSNTNSAGYVDYDSNSNSEFNSASNSEFNATSDNEFNATSNSAYNSIGNVEMEEEDETDALIKRQDSEKQRKELLQKAEAQLREVLSDTSMLKFRASSERLINLIKYRVDPLARRAELGERLADSKEDKNIFNDLTDYIWLLDQTESEASDVGPERDKAEAEASGKSDDYTYDYQLKLRDIPAEMRQDDLTDWLYTYQSADGFRHSYDKWKETGKQHWLTAAISKVSKDDTEVSELITDGSKIKAGASSYPTIRFHQIRLLIDLGKRDEAQALTDEVLSTNFESYPVSTKNQFYSQKMVLAKDLDEFLKFAQRKAATFVWSDDSNEQGDDLSDMKEIQPWANRTMFDQDAVAFLNEKMPLSVMRQAAISPNLPAHLKPTLVSAVWTRAVVLGNKAIEQEFADLMLEHNKQFMPEVRNYAVARTPLASEAQALMLILKYPVIQPYVPVGMGRDTPDPRSIDSIRGNWWCAPDTSEEAYTHYDHYDFRYPSAYPEFLTAAQTSEAEAEYKKLQEAGNSATYLARTAVEFAKANSRYRDVPEMLHLAVRSTRYGCTDTNTEKASKQAFDVLHKSYPGSIWTKKTPYWFK